MPETYLCVHGHFYQPPRQNPFSGVIDREAAAAPYPDFNEKIWDECYRPNAEQGNFHCLSFDLGPTLAAWLQTAHPATLKLMMAASAGVYRQTGHGNGMAQAYHHTILPLATRREKQLQIAWGVRDFRNRFGYAPEGLWLPETAADDETLELLAAHGLRFTILAPWQAVQDGLDTTEPYRVALPGGRSLAVFFYNSALSGDVSFNGDATADAARFSAEDLAAHINRAKESEGRPQLLLIATDGELYGHHKKFRDLFLTQLLNVEAPACGYAITTPGAHLAHHAPTLSMQVRPNTSWSCAHGVARWDVGCACTEGDSSWKLPLRQALRGLATHLDSIFESEAAPLLPAPWTALEEYTDLRDGVLAPAEYWRTHAPGALRSADEQRLKGLLEMQFARQAMFVSCAWFFEDLDRLEPRIALAHAHRAITLAARHSGADLAPAFSADLGASLSLRSGRSAADIYQECAESVQHVA